MFVKRLRGNCCVWIIFGQNPGTRKVSPSIATKIENGPGRRRCRRQGWSALWWGPPRTWQSPRSNSLTSAQGLCSQQLVYMPGKVVMIFVMNEQRYLYMFQRKDDCGHLIQKSVNLPQSVRRERWQWWAHRWQLPRRRWPRSSSWFWSLEPSHPHQQCWKVSLKMWLIKRHRQQCNLLQCNDTDLSDQAGTIAGVYISQVKYAPLQP